MTSKRHVIPGLGTKLTDLSSQRKTGFQVKSFATRTLIPKILPNIISGSMKKAGETCIVPDKISSTMTSDWHLSEMSPIGSCISIPGPYLVVLSRDVKEVWPCWVKYHSLGQNKNLLSLPVYPLCLRLPFKIRTLSFLLQQYCLLAAASPP